MSSSKMEDIVMMADTALIKEDDTCSICMESLWLSKYTRTPECQPAGMNHYPVSPKVCDMHCFHYGCLADWLKQKQVCPLCRTHLVQLTGYQPVSPLNRATVVHEISRLPGYETVGTLTLEYFIAAGVQTLNDPLPGHRFDSFTIQTYLPDNSEGAHVATLLDTAWRRGLLFRIGYNAVTKCMDTIVVNGLELKRFRRGGHAGYGYPDPSYMSRMRQDLMEIGIN